jgi:cysteine sulfinate desulfinase/cysteine desulfurase-like protein
MTVGLDNAASTPPSPEVVEAVAHAMREHYANPLSASTRPSGSHGR